MPRLTRPRERGDGARRFLPEVQALRAVAVLLVVLYHLWPDRLTGGYVGVDVFFVISGFLMTSHITGGIASASGFTLRGFYARRVRRLLPASLLVLLVVAIAVLVWAPTIAWVTAGQNIVASALYVENWSLLANAVDYLGASTTIIPTQHFWSLSVEEQFYALWPILLLGAAWLAVRLPRRRDGRVAGSAKVVSTVVMAVVAVASLVFSLALTSSDPAAAYFHTGTRVWEFAAGGLAAMAAARFRPGPAFAAAMAWSGLLGIAVSALVYTDDTPFPGFAAALPVAATVLVLLAGDPIPRWGPSALYRLRPVQFVGDISYSVYLWHWPVIVILPWVIDRPLSTVTRVAIGVVSLALAWLTKRFVEDRFRAPRRRQDPHTRTRPSRVFLAAVLAMVLVAGTGGVAWGVGQNRVDRATAALAALPPLACLGAGAATASAAECAQADRLPDAIYPDPIIALADSGGAGCQQTESEIAVLSCHAGPKKAGFRVALVGDSHAAQWLSAVRTVAVSSGWSLTSYLRSGCGLRVSDGSDSGPAKRCDQWNTRVLSELAAGDFDLVLVSTRASLVGGGQMSAQQQRDVANSMVRAWKKVQSSGARVVAIRDTPQPVSAGIPDLPQCVGTHPGRLAACAFAADKALVEDPQLIAARADGVDVVDMTSAVCPGGSCRAVVGHVLTWIDGHHLSALYASSLASALQVRIAGVGVRVGS